MESIALTLPDGSVRETAIGSTALDVAKSIGPGLAKAAIGAELGGRRIDLREPLKESGPFRLFTNRDSEAGDFIRHSAEHVMADAVMRLWPDSEYDAGRQDHSEKYQYDFRFPRPFTPKDLERIESEMRKILAEDREFVREEVSRDEAEALFRELGAELKIERLADIPEGETITIFRHGDFIDLCRGPHVQRMSQIGAVKLIEASAVYFKGDEQNERLQRIFGTAFGKKAELAAYLERIEQARARDHRRIGTDLDLFSFNAHAPASPFFHAKGTVIYRLLEDFVREFLDRDGYEEVLTPQILDVDLWHRSGHYENYHDAMYFTEADERQFAVKPMNCPTHCLIYGTRRRSYRDLPMRIADFGRLHRYERSGVTTGLTRVRSFCQDDGHIFCTEDQIGAEVLSVVEAILEIYRVFDFSDVLIELSTRPEKSIGTAELWERAETALKNALDGAGIAYEINEGDGAFYGPKIDFQVRDAIGRSWQLGTVQLDYQMPQRFDLSYVGEDGNMHCPVMIHRAMLGSLERFFGILIEHTAGAFPLWLAPVQAVVLPVSERFLEYAQQVRKQLAQAGVRVELDDRNEKLGYKIREAQMQKVPVMLVIGQREQEANTAAVRLRDGRDLGTRSLDEIAEELAAATGSRSEAFQEPTNQNS